MSKSKGEFLTVSLLESKGYDPIVYRFFCLQSHYRKSLVFSYENLDNAKTAFDKLIARIAQLKAEGDTQGVDRAKFDELKKGFKDALDNDINTALGITAVYDVLKADTNAATKLALVDDFDKVLSLGLLQHAQDLLKSRQQEDIPEDIKELVEQRAQARKAKDFAKADALRDEITARGYIIEETRQGTKIKRK